MQIRFASASTNWPQLSADETWAAGQALNDRHSPQRRQKPVCEEKIGWLTPPHDGISFLRLSLLGCPQEWLKEVAFRREDRREMKKPHAPWGAAGHRQRLCHRRNRALSSRSIDWWKALESRWTAG